jgi:hypothetical protein
LGDIPVPIPTILTEQKLELHSLKARILSSKTVKEIKINKWQHSIYWFCK